MARIDLHVHSIFSDGKNTPEEMVREAIARGMDAIGFSDHSYTFFDESYCIPKAELARYRACVEELKNRYRGKIRVLCGIEQDFYSQEPCEGYDYVIGSVHYIRAGEEYIPVDESPEILRAAAEKHFGGDLYALIEEYYRTAARVVQKTGAHIIGHFDLIAKFNEGGALFDETDPRYVAASREAADCLLKTGRPFEINTGAVSRSFRTVPYPSGALRDYIRGRGGRFVLASDSHEKDGLCFLFEAFQKEAEDWTF